MATIAEQRIFTPVARRDLVQALGTAAEELGLKGKDLPVLLALLSFIRLKGTGASAAITPGQLLCVFASNAAIVERCQVPVDERSVRRSIDRFCALGLAVRRDSNNGKRFPRYQNGVLVAAFGIDLAPLVYRAEAIQALALKVAQDNATLRALRSEARQLCNRALSQAANPDVIEWFAQAARAVRRRIGLSALSELHRQIVERLHGLMQSPAHGGPTAEIPQQETWEAHTPDTASATPLPASAGLPVRQRTKKTENKKQVRSFSRSVHIVWSEASELQAFFPECPKTETELIRILVSFAEMMGIDCKPVIQAIAVKGSALVAKVLNNMALNACNIAKPAPFFHQAIARNF